MPTLAESYAANMAAELAVLSGVEATVPPGWNGPGGLMSAVVSRNGQSELTFMNITQTVPASVLLAFADWVIATYRTEI